MSSVPLSKGISGKILPGMIINIAPVAGTGKFTFNGDTYVRNGTVIPDVSDLEPSLVSLRRYRVNGGQDTFSSALGTVAATTKKNANGTTIIFVNSSNVIHRSTNNGVDYSSSTALSGYTWRATHSDSANVSQATGTIICCIIRDNADTKIARSVDDGATFSVLNVASGTNDSAYVVFCATDGIWYLGTHAGNIYKSTDDGATWTNTSATGQSGSAQPTIVSLSQTANNRIIAGGANGAIIYTDNSGASWNTATGLGGGHRVGIAYIGKRNSDDIVIAVSIALNAQYISIDNGATWQRWTKLDSLTVGAGIFSIWSDGNGTAVLGATQQNYSSTADRTMWYTSSDYCDTLESAGVTQTDAAIGLVKGAKNRLFIATYTSSDDSYAYLDLGFSSGGRIDAIEQATLIKNGV